MIDFDGLSGQAIVKDKLARFMRFGAPGHAHLFAGAEGMGKRAFAQVFAKALLCVGAPFVSNAFADSEAARLPCGNCLPCKLFHTGASGDFLFIEPTGQGQRPAISVEAARQITGWLAIRPLYSRRKVCLIAQADHMTEQAQNALLKTLEEPPAYGILILTAANPGMLLDTVRSRCGATFFAGYTDNEVEYILKNSPAPPHDSIIALVSRLAGGNPGYAFELASSDTFLSTRDELIGLFCGYLDGDPTAPFLLSSFLDRNKDRYLQFVGILIHFLRDIWLYSLPGGEKEIANRDMGQKLKRYGERFRQSSLMECIECMDDSYSQVSANANFTLTVNAMLINIKALLNAA